MASIKNYGVSKKKICDICKQPVWNYVTCTSCGKFFCRKHKPLFQSEWNCPKCDEAIKMYANSQQAGLKIYNLIKIANHTDSDALNDMIIDLLFREKI